MASEAVLFQVKSLKMREDTDKFLLLGIQIAFTPKPEPQTYRYKQHAANGYPETNAVLKQWHIPEIHAKNASYQVQWQENSC